MSGNDIQVTETKTQEDIHRTANSAKIGKYFIRNAIARL
jgi:hypothetical protein